MIRYMAFRHAGGIKYSRETPCVHVVSFVLIAECFFKIFPRIEECFFRIFPRIAECFFRIFPRICESSIEIGSCVRDKIGLTQGSTAMVTPKTRHPFAFCLSDPPPSFSLSALFQFKLTAAVTFSVLRLIHTINVRKAPIFFVKY